MVNWDAMIERYGGENGDRLAAPQIQGQIPGLDGALRDFLRTYEMPDDFPGIKESVLALPVPTWSEWGWVEAGNSGSQIAGFSGDMVVYTVPGDERAVLYSCEIVVSIGDNTAQWIFITQPEGYRAGDGILMLVYPVTASVSMYWPADGTLAMNRATGPSPILLEPGATVAVTASGAGSAASTFYYALSMRGTKITRAFAP